MNKRLHSRSTVYLFATLLMVVLTGSSMAQTPSPPVKPVEEKVFDTRAQPIQDRVPAPSQRKPAATSSYERRFGKVTLPVTRGVQLSVDNRSIGRITVHGWDRDDVEARATSERGDEVVILAQSGGEGPLRLFIKADYADLGTADPTAHELEDAPVNSEGIILVHLEVKAPRYTEIEVIRVIRSDVEVIGIETAVAVIGHSSNITLKDVGSVEAHTRTGWIAIENARGIADVSSSTGKIGITNSRGAVRAVSIAGPIVIRCVKGRIDVSNTQAPIELFGIDGDVDAIAASSDVRFTGPLSEDGRYLMRSMSGLVELIIPADTRGFNATLTSYRGSVESDFSLVAKTAAPDSVPTKHRLAGRFGKASSQITLDSFQGLVKLTRAARNSIEPCK